MGGTGYFTVPPCPARCRRSTRQTLTSVSAAARPRTPHAAKRRARTRRPRHTSMALEELALERHQRHLQPRLERPCRGLWRHARGLAHAQRLFHVHGRGRGPCQAQQPPVALPLMEPCCIRCQHPRCRCAQATHAPPGRPSHRHPPLPRVRHARPGPVWQWEHVEGHQWLHRKPQPACSTIHIIVD